MILLVYSYYLALVNKQFNPEKYILDKRIEYRLWWNWPVYYDCWWVVTEVYRKMWYKWNKISSKTLQCKKSITLAKKYDILINPNIHVALITSKYKNWSVQILDYVNTFHYPSYRYHGWINWTYVLDKNCLLNL